MALIGQDVPFSQQLSNIGNIDLTAGTTNLLGGSGTLNTVTPTQTNLASVLSPTAGGAYGGGIQGASNISQLLQLLGLGTYGQGQALLGQGQATETSGLLPASGQQLVQTQLNDAIAQIKGKYASLGMTGSTAEAAEIADMQNRSTGQQFTLASALGGQEANQGLQALQQGAGTVGSAGTLAGTLGNLGIQGLNLTSNDLQNIARNALDQMQIGQTGITGGANIFSGLATAQIAQDKNTQDTLGSFFKAIAGNSGLFGNTGLIPGIQSLWNQPQQPTGA